MPLSDDRREAARTVEMLSKQEKDVLVLLINGWSFSSIADELSVDIDRLEGVRRSLMTKIGAEHTADAVRIGLHLASHRLLELPERPL
jgi:two-component system, LuxR family, response regulator FixJ